MYLLPFYRYFQFTTFKKYSGKIIFFFYFSMKLLALLLNLAMGMYFHLSPGHKKCIKEEIHKDVVVTGEFEAKESPGHRVSFFWHFSDDFSVIFSNKIKIRIVMKFESKLFLGRFKSYWLKRSHFVSKRKCRQWKICVHDWRPGYFSSLFRVCPNWRVQ